MARPSGRATTAAKASIPQLAWDAVRPAPVILVSGTETVLADRAIRQLRDILKAEDPSLEVSDLDTEIIDVLRRYEPRLDKGSLRVSRDKSVHPDELKIRYIVQADLICEPLNIPLKFIADVEIVTGKIKFDRI